MNWSNLSLAHKLRLPIALVGFILLALSIVQISALNTISTDSDHIENTYIPAINLTLNADRDLYQAQIAERSIALGIHTKNFIDMHSANLNQVQDRINKVRGLDIPVEIQQQADKFLAAYSAWRPKSEKLVAQTTNGQLSQSDATEMSTNALDKEFESMRDQLDALGEMIAAAAESLHADNMAVKDSSLSVILTLVVIAIGVTLFIAVVVPKLIIRPINNLTRVLESLADGRGDLTARLPTTGDDEVGRMAKSFNRFLDRMQTLVRNIQLIVEDVRASSAELKSGADESQALSKQYAESMDMVANANREMAEAIEEVARTTVEVSEEAKDSDTTAKAVANQFRSAVTDIMALAGSVNDASIVIKDLEKETVNIASVLDVIKGIAEQTNLLALNAAIEAARAGEQGRGFAVVADEVRTLAGKTQKSTGDINTMIDKLQSGVDRAVNSMKGGEEKAEGTVTSARESEEQVKQISASLIRITDRILRVASAIEEQTSVINEINGNLSNARDLSKTGQASAEKITVSVGILNKRAEDINSQISNYTF
ncbi:methyl-accepting chemotaxis protein [Thalassolituus oleivorans]|jgi:methyl-accepting chemotaxis protein|uniref:Probable chemotaxis transducer n=3 Tax=Thalassolituus oleivorans TaxID=187493 RepID=M5DUW3_9GAMM|nr:methyl-accepting chemotaxis protein [Thalassolituus oleivorans]CCU73344.1 probable chemotaxis transducer [Thalassolituus oleivorans MIL-1]